jgi:hypothetical protein
MQVEHTPAATKYTQAQLPQSWERTGKDKPMRAFNHKIRLSTATLLAMVLASYLYSASADAAELRNISKVNSGVRVAAGEQLGDISSVNGGIDLASGASAQEVGTVNGGIDLDDNVTIKHPETVNGGIRVGENVSVHGYLTTVNGGIRTGAGTVIEARVRTVNGKIQLRNTTVSENVETSNGDISLRNASIVEGDLLVAKSRRNWWGRIWNSKRRRPEITIDATSSVRGDIHLYREVDLRIDDAAVVGEIIRHY